MASKLSFYPVYFHHVCRERREKRYFWGNNVLEMVFLKILRNQRKILFFYFLGCFFFFYLP